MKTTYKVASILRETFVLSRRRWRTMPMCLRSFEDHETMDNNGFDHRELFDG